MKIQRLYHHCFVEDLMGVRCKCGCDVNDLLLAPVPCSIPTAYYTRLNNNTLIGDKWLIISVWNCYATVFAYDDLWSQKPVWAIVPYDEETENFFQNQIIQCVERAGGAVNFSGQYGVDNILAEQICRLYAGGQLKLEIMSP